MINIHKKWLGLLATGTAGFTVAVDFTIVNASLNSLQSDLHVSLATLQWVISGFGILFSSLLVIMGRLGDVYGHRKLLIMSCVVFVVACIIAGVATDIYVLIIMRMLQGLSAAAILPCGTAYTTRVFPSHERAKALGLYASIIGIGLGMGPLFGSLIEYISNWRWVFFINIPFLVFSLMITLFKLEETNQLNRNIEGRSAVLLMTAVGGTALLFTTPNLFLLGIVTLISLTFYYHEKKAKLPIIPIQLLSKPSVTLGICLYIGAVSLHWPILFYMPLYLHQVAGYSESVSALILSVMTGMTMVAPLFSGYLFDNHKVSIWVHFVFVLSLLSLLIFCGFRESSSIYVIIISFIMYGLSWGIGNGIAMPIALSGLSNSQDSGLVSGILTTALNIVAVMSLSASVLIMKGSLLVANLHVLFACLLLVTCIMWVISIFLLAKASV